MYESLKLRYEIEIGRFAYVISTARESQNNKYELLEIIITIHYNLPWDSNHKGKFIN